MSECECLVEGIVRAAWDSECLVAHSEGVVGAASESECLVEGLARIARAA